MVSSSTTPITATVTVTVTATETETATAIAATAKINAMKTATTVEVAEVLEETIAIEATNEQEQTMELLLTRLSNEYKDTFTSSALGSNNNDNDLMDKDLLSTSRLMSPLLQDSILLLDPLNRCNNSNDESESDTTLPMIIDETKATTNEISLLKKTKEMNESTKMITPTTIETNLPKKTEETNETTKMTAPVNVPSARIRLDQFEMSCRSQSLELSSHFLKGTSDVELQKALGKLLQYQRGCIDVCIHALRGAIIADNDSKDIKDNDASTAVVSNTAISKVVKATTSNVNPYLNLGDGLIIRRLSFHVIEDTIDILPVPHLRLYWKYGPAIWYPSILCNDIMVRFPSSSSLASKVSTSSSSSPKKRRMNIPPKKVTATLFQQTSQYTLIRTCNRVLKNISSNDNVTTTTFAGDVMMLLSKVFPLSERSAVNVLGAFHTNSAVAYESLEEWSKQGGGSSKSNESNSNGSNTSSTADGKNNESILSYNFYAIFWNMQRYFADPQTLLLLNNDEGTFKTTAAASKQSLKSQNKHQQQKSTMFQFINDANTILSAFESNSFTEDVRKSLRIRWLAAKECPVLIIPPQRTSQKKRKRQMSNVDPSPFLMTHQSSTSDGDKGITANIATTVANGEPVSLTKHHKYLTNSQLFRLQLGDDPELRVHFLTQLLIIVPYLSSQLTASASLASATTSSSQTTTATISSLNNESSILLSRLDELKIRAGILLHRTPPNGPEHLRILRWILSERESVWISWKLNKCLPAIERTFGESNNVGDGVASRAVGGVVGGLEQKDCDNDNQGMSWIDVLSKTAPPLINDTNDEDDDNEDTFYPPDIDLRNDLLYPPNDDKNPRRKQEQQQRPMAPPSIYEFLEEYVDALDPRSGIEEEYHPRNNALYKWRALRLLSSSYIGRFGLEKTGAFSRAVTVAIAKIDESKVTDRTDTKDEHDKNESNMRDENVTKTVSETMGTRRMVRRNDGDFEVLVRTVWKEQRGINIPGDWPKGDDDDILKTSVVIQEEDKEKVVEQNKYENDKNRVDSTIIPKVDNGQNSNLRKASSAIDALEDSEMVDNIVMVGNNAEDNNRDGNSGDVVAKKDVILKFSGDDRKNVVFKNNVDDKEGNENKCIDDSDYKKMIEETERGKEDGDECGDLFSESPSTGEMEEELEIGPESEKWNKKDDDDVLVEDNDKSKKIESTRSPQTNLTGISEFKKDVKVSPKLSSSKVDNISIIGHNVDDSFINTIDQKATRKRMLEIEEKCDNSLSKKLNNPNSSFSKKLAVCSNDIFSKIEEIPSSSEAKVQVELQKCSIEGKTDLSNDIPLLSNKIEQMVELNLSITSKEMVRSDTLSEQNKQKVEIPSKQVVLSEKVILSHVSENISTLAKTDSISDGTSKDISTRVGDHINSNATLSKVDNYEPTINRRYGRNNLHSARRWSTDPRDPRVCTRGEDQQGRGLGNIGGKGHRIAPSASLHPNTRSPIGRGGRVDGHSTNDQAPNIPPPPPRRGERSNHSSWARTDRNGGRRTEQRRR